MARTDRQYLIKSDFFLKAGTIQLLQTEPTAFISCPLLPSAGLTQYFNIWTGTFHSQQSGYELNGMWILIYHD